MSAGMVVVAACVLLGCARTPVVETVVPPTLTSLDPQLRETIEAKLKQLQDDPKAVELHVDLALIYAANDLWAPAWRGFSNVTRLKPQEPLASLYMGIAAAEMTDLPAARASIQKVTELHPNFIPGWYRLGELGLKAGDLASAEIAFNRLATLDPKEWRAFEGLGTVAFQRGDWNAAVAAFEKALQLEPQAHSVHHPLGLCLQRLGRSSEAEWHLAFGRDSDRSPLRDAWSDRASEFLLSLDDQFSQANALAAAGQAPRAVEVLSRTWRFHPGNAAVANQLAIALNRSGRAAEAQQLLTEVLRKEPKQLAPWITLSFSESQLGRHREALQAADQAIALATNIPQAYVARANAWLGMERDLEAVAAFETALQVDPNNAEIHLELADVLWRNLDRGPDALDHARRARKLAPVNPAVYPRLVSLESKFGTAAAAAEALQVWRRLDPSSPEIRHAEAELRLR